VSKDELPIPAARHFPKPKEKNVDSKGKASQKEIPVIQMVDWEEPSTSAIGNSSRRESLQLHKPTADPEDTAIEQVEQFLQDPFEQKIERLYCHTMTNNE